MRTDNLNEVERIIILAIDEKINKYKELILELEKEKQKYVKQRLLPPEKETKVYHTPPFRATPNTSKKDRIVAAIQRMSGEFNTEQLLATINTDGGHPLTKENFAPTFSRLKDEYYKRVGEKDGRGLYEKIE
ncbi:MAG TPA: hypothetical protein VN604_05040 [Nitrospirota bacterium]|nr:hypothetical protein [Nitrospirota bacterium]